MSHRASRVTRWPRNSSGMMVSVAAAALPMPNARKPAARPMLITTYQREVVRASSARLRTMVTPRWRGVSEPDARQGGGRVEAERRRRVGQRQIVVDGLGNVGHADGPAGLLVDLAGREGGVIAADGDQGGDPEPAQGAEHGGHGRFGPGGVVPRRAQDGAAAESEVLDV